MSLAMNAKKIDDAYDKMMKNMNKNQKSKKLDKKKIDDELDKMIKHVKKNEKKLDKETKKIDDKYAKLMKDFKKDLTNENESDAAYKKLWKEHAKEFYKGDKPSKKTGFKRDLELERKIFDYMRVKD